MIGGDDGEGVLLLAATGTVSMVGGSLPAEQ